MKLCLKVFVTHRKLIQKKQILWIKFAENFELELLLAENLGIISTKRLTENGNFSVTDFKYFDMKKVNSVRKFRIRIAVSTSFLDRTDRKL